MTRKLASIMLLSALAAFPAFAGGQATIKVSELDKALVANKTVQVGFTVHDAIGRPLEELKPVVIVTSGGRKAEFPAMHAKAIGTYTAAVTFPAAGEWTLTVDSHYCGNTNVMKGVKVLAAR